MDYVPATKDAAGNEYWICRNCESEYWPATKTQEEIWVPGWQISKAERNYMRALYTIRGAKKKMGGARNAKRRKKKYAFVPWYQRGLE